jgi:hypothetical protein
MKIDQMFINKHEQKLQYNQNIIFIEEKRGYGFNNISGVFWN